jgi:hypothetical protein
MKSDDSFGNDKSKSDGKRIYCRSCEREKRKQQYDLYREKIIKNGTNYYENNKDMILENRKDYYKKNQEQIKERSKTWRDNNKDKISEQKKEYNKANRDRVNLYLRARYENDYSYAFKIKIKKIIQKNFKKMNYTKKSKSLDILGCDFECFRLYIESKFEPWMNWDNYGLYNGEFNYGWDLDHIIPISSATSEEQVLNLNHFSNFQPLCSKFNRDIKRNKQF